MRRMMCIHFPLWPIQRLRGVRPELSQAPLVLFEPSRGKLVVRVCSPAAGKLGVRAGLPLGEAQAILGPKTAVHTERWDPSADRESLRKAAVWCQRFSPLVAVDEPDSLMLDITGCGPFFGGESQLAGKAVAQLRQRGYIARAAIADTAAAAWAIVHYQADAVHVIPRGGHREALRSLPIEALRLTADVLDPLQQLDVRFIGQLMKLPRSSLPSRFGPMVLERLDLALGDAADALAPEGFVEPPAASWNFDYPCADKRTLESVVERLLETVLEKLRPQQAGVQRLLCDFHRAGLPPQSMVVGLLHASRSLPYLMTLVRLQLEQLRFDNEITGMAVRALAMPLSFRQGRIFEDDDWQERREQIPVLVEMLSNRLGKEAVLRPLLDADPQPEYAWHYEPWLESRLTDAELADAPPHREGLFRPLCLKHPPIAIAAMSVFPNGPPLRFEWQRRSLVIAHSWGPERIETGWWREADTRRDYYLVETTTAERFWLFRVTEGERWFLHGIST